MAAVQDQLTPQVRSTASTEALELLNCFSDGIEDLVYQTAEVVARKRACGSLPSGKPVEIELQDVRQAGELVIAAIKKIVAAGSLPPDVGESVDEMHRCLNCKTEP